MGGSSKGEDANVVVEEQKPSVTPAATAAEVAGKTW